MLKIDCLQFNLCGINLWRLLGLYLASLPCNPSDIPPGFKQGCPVKPKEHLAIAAQSQQGGVGG